MTRRRRSTSKLAGVVVAAVFAATACKPESARRADRAAKDVVEQRDDLVKAAKNIADEPEQVLAEVGQLAAAAEKFDKLKQARLAALRGQHSVIASQTLLIGTMARELPITDAARGDINEKLTRFQARLDEAQNLIEGLSRTMIDDWEQLDTAATDAMQRLDDARKAAWESLEDAPHIDHSAS